GESGLIVNASKFTGVLSGVVLTSDKNQPIQNARIFVKGTSIDAKTDENGKFSVTIPANTNVSISIVHSEYSAETITKIKVAKDETLSREVKLTPASMELEEFIVLAPKVTGSLASVMAEEKKSSAITNILSSEQMSKKGDSSAASALKRVTGVTLVGGKSIFVRGLGDRYSNIEMNSMPLPSPDPTKRIVPLDIFPSGVISSMKVQKSATADIPVNFGGGYIDIRTKDSSKDDYVKLSLELKGNSNTGKDSITHQGSGSDFLGFDDGYRAIDSSIINNSEINLGERTKAFTTRYFTKEELSDFTQKYVANRDYSVYNEALPMGGSGSIEAALNYDIADKHKITLFGNYKYKQEHKYREEEINKYSMDIYTDSLIEKPTQTGTAKKSYSDYSQSGIFNIGYNYADVFKIKFTKLYTHNGTQVTKLTHGKFGSNQDEIYTFYDLQWEERTLDTNQISGNFDYAIFNQESNFRFGLEYATATLVQPNNYRYYYLQDSSSINGAPFLSNQNSNHVAVNLDSNDEQNALYLKNKFHLDLLSEDDYIDVGFTANSKTRESKQNKYFLSYANTATTPVNTYTDDIDTTYDTHVRSDIDYDDRNLLLSNLTLPSDYFDAEVDESNFYLNTFLKPLDNLEVLFGARQVNVTQTTYEYQEDSDNPDFALRRNIIRTSKELSIDDIYPSISAKAKLDENNHIDLAYSTTYIMPDFRESSDGIYSHPYEIADILGNPDLVYTNIVNYDLKYSHYFSNSENIKLGLFYKKLDKPIEDVMMPTSSLPIYSFDNSDSAELLGFEIDGRKKLDFIDSRLNNYYLSGNFSYTDSDVTLTKEQEATYTNNHRQLQGLSQVVLNAGVSYEQRGRSVTLNYNKMGERIRKVGMIEANGGGLPDSRYPDYMEDPAAVLDFVWIEKYKNGLSFRVKLGNLLDGETVWFQESKKYITNRFKKGRDYSISLSYKY
ncbi:MAG: carboxypeptidase-like regulatory domain-containing protein, partial [Campylobacterota bacterium]|nr:carboxypeptidase-like regulatory domain-containing protein [Campylobacterota bacterium]